MAGGETLLEGRGLRKRFGDIIAVDGISVALESGRILAVLGPNGAGKTTTVAMLAGLTTPDAGAVLIGGRAPAGATHPRPGPVGGGPPKHPPPAEGGGGGNTPVFRRAHWA